MIRSKFSWNRQQTDLPMISREIWGQGEYPEYPEYSKNCHQLGSHPLRQKLIICMLEGLIAKTVTT